MKALATMMTYVHGGGQGILSIWIPILSVLLFLVLGLAVLIYFGESYKVLPGWGPRVLSDGSKDDVAVVRTRGE